MKKAFVLILAMLLTVTCWGGSAAEEKQTEYQSDYYNYVLLEDGTAEIASYRGEASSLSIPGKLDGYTVTSIGDSVFSECKSLTSMTIPGSVTSIGDGAFKDCDQLTLTVSRDSYSEEFAIKNDILYTYPDATDWLNN